MNSWTLCIQFVTTLHNSANKSIGKSRPILIDNIFANTYDKLFAGNLLDKMSDHLPNFLIINDIKSSLIKGKIVVRDFEKFNKHHYQQDIIELNNIDLLQWKGVNEMYSVYQDHLVEIINNNAPLKTISVKEKKRRLKPWIITYILISIKTKNSYYETVRKTKAKFW